MNQKKFWVYISLTAGAPDSMSMALLAKAQQLAEENGMLLEAVVVGEGSRTAAEKLAEQGVQTVYNADIPGMSQVEFLRIADLICPLVKDLEPEIFLFPATDSASAVASTVGVRLQTGVNVHCVTADMRDGIFIGSVPAFGGQVMSEILCPVKKPQMATVRLNGGEFRDGPVGKVVDFAAESPALEGLELVSVETEQSTGISIGDARLILCAGAGVGDAEGFQMLTALADKMGAAVACTRDVLDMDIGASDAQMVGVSGATIMPKVYVGFGVSGSAHHMFGMKDSGIILNVNTNKKNLFFPASDHGFVGDAKSVMKALFDALE